MLISEYFERIYVVNLPHRTDRRRAMENELAQAGMQRKAEFFPAVRPATAGQWPSIGARGCFQSHLTILERARADGLANVLVMEDDLEIDPRLASHEAPLVAELERTDWGLVYFGHRAPTKANGVSLRATTEPLQTTHFYGVNGTLFDRLIAFLLRLQERPAGHPDGGPMHLDGAYCTFRAQNPDVVTLITAPSLGRQRSSNSDVTPTWFDEVVGLRSLAKIARTLKLWTKGRGDS